MQEFFLGHSVLIGESKTFQFQMYICDVLVAHLNQRSGTAFLDRWVMYVFWLGFLLGTCCLYTGFGRVLNFCVMIRSHVISFFFCTFTREQGTHAQFFLGQASCFSTHAITDWLPLCSHSARISVGFLGKSCADYGLTVRLRAWISPALQSYSDLAMISDYAIICCADSYSLFLWLMEYYLANMEHSIISILWRSCFSPVFFLASRLELRKQMRVISFVWVKTSQVVAEFARIRYDLFYGMP